MIWEQTPWDIADWNIPLTNLGPGGLGSSQVPKLIPGFHLRPKGTRPFENKRDFSESRSFIQYNVLDFPSTRNWLDGLWNSQGRSAISRVGLYTTVHLVESGPFQDRD